MQLSISPPRGRRLWLAAALLGLTIAALALKGPLMEVGALVLAAGLLCFAAAPLARLYEKRLSRSAAAVLSLVTLGLALGLLLWLLLPTMLRELIDMAGALPGALRQLSDFADGWRGRIQARFPGLQLPKPDLTALQGLLTKLAGGTVGLAVNLADVIGRASLVAMLACFMLCDRDRLLLRLELLLPRFARSAAVRMGKAVCRELRLYLGAQLTVALAVGALSAAALALVGVRSALTLGPVVGLMNMIPYVGPFIGGIPAVLIALGDGWQKVLLTVGALAVVQQLDGALISPRIIGSLTGFSPALVLVGVFAGARLGGIAGMLFALPVMMVGRTLFRVFVQKCENI
ncbi:MAG: AI-2E family transporter [Clostridia bacterium]|nr:AI-2E family transporter [Clostridia bacterium]